MSADYLSLLPREFRPGMLIRLYVPSSQDERDCEVVRVQKVQRDGTTKYAVTVLEPDLRRSTRIIAPRDRIKVRKIEDE